MEEMAHPIINTGSIMAIAKSSHRIHLDTQLWGGGSMDFSIVESIEYITSANHGAGGAGPWFNVPTLGDFVATVGK